MSDTNFKRVTYLAMIIVFALTAYLALIRKLTNGDSATIRNANFLGVKSISVQNNVSNQDELNIDGDQSTPSTASDQTSTSPSTPGSNNKGSGLYTVEEGDTYGCIAEKYYGSYEHWPDVLNYNAKYGSGFSEHNLHVGAVLEMPTISPDSLKPKSNLCS